MKIYIGLFMILSVQAFSQSPIKVGVAGLTHGHVDWVFNSGIQDDIIVVGIFETNKELVDLYTKRYKLDPSLFYTNLEEMLDSTIPDAVVAFGATSEHIGVVRASAPRNIHVMVEKPLATNLKDALEIEALANEHEIYVLTNYETSWYASTYKIKEMLEQGDLGDLRKVMVNSGHSGPKEIGVSKEFLEILTDPEKNGAGALMDFGCYGANLMTWLLNGEKPVSVTAVVHQNKPEIYPNVDDEATIILQYPNSQCVIQGSWNWPISRKEMEVYGETGYAIAKDETALRINLYKDKEERETILNPVGKPHNNPFSFLAAVIKKEHVLQKNDLYGLPVNMVVMEILEAAKQSATQGKTVFLD